MSRLSVFVLVSIVFSSCSEKINYPRLIQLEASKKNTVFSNVNIFNGNDSVLIMNQDVWIKDGKIHQITSHKNKAEDMPPPPGYRVIEGAGQTLMPGLIDAHVHVSGNGSVPWKAYKTNINYNLESYLYTGITTVYDLGGLSKKLEKLQQDLAKQKILGPQLHHTHIPVTVKNSHPIPLTKEVLSWPLNKLVNAISPTITNESDAVKIVSSYKKIKVDYMKIVVDQIPEGSKEMPYHLLKALVDESHKQGLKVFVHIGSPQNAMDALRTGADVLAHGIWRGKLSEDQADSLAAAQIPIIYTFAGFKNVGDIHRCSFHPSERDKHIIPNLILDPVTDKQAEDLKTETEAMAQFFSEASQNQSNLINNFNLLHKKGARILIGTDSSLPGTYAGVTYLQELDLLHEMGVSSYRLLRAATCENAHLLSENPTYGEIAVGKDADLLLIEGNVMEHLENLEHPLKIMTKGRLIERLK